MPQLHSVGKSKISGFTIVEVMTVIVITALLIVAALPSYENFMRNNEAMEMADRLANSLRLAKAEAIKYGIPVTVCPIDSSFDTTTTINETSEQWPCQNITAWDAWKVMQDPDFNAVENFTNGWPVLEYSGNIMTGSITSNISGPITFDPMGFANIDPSVTRSGWSWSDSFSSGEWTWSYAYSSSYSGTYYRIFTITPSGCTGNNARTLQITQNGVITITEVSC